MFQELDKISEVARYLWEKGWAEYNGGNISVNLTEQLQETFKEKGAISVRKEIASELKMLAGELFYVTGTGKRMRDVARSPWENGALIRICDDGRGYELIYKDNIPPTSELISHLYMHHCLRQMGRDTKVVLHTHPTELIALTHIKRWLDSEALTQMLWSMIPECRMVVTKGVGVVPYISPGTVELAEATVVELEKHDVIIWEKHGVLAVGDDITTCFDTIDTLNKSAQIYIHAKAAGLQD